MKAPHTIAIAPPSTQTNGNAVNGSTIDLDGTFALNGAMQPLRILWDKKQLAIVEAAGSPDPSRSHFEAQDSMECGTPGKAAGTGWLNRALPEASGEPAKMRAVAMGKQVPHCLRGGNEAQRRDEQHVGEIVAGLPLAMPWPGGGS